MKQSMQSKPWYREFWPWFVFFIPFATVVAGIAMIVISRHEADSVIVDDYYKEGLAINKNFQREQMAKQLGLTTDVTIDLLEQHITINIDNLEIQQYPKLIISLSHPTLAIKDQNLILSPDQSGAYSGTLKNLTAGKWYIQIEPDNAEWRISGELNVRQKGIYQLSSAE